MNKVDFAYKGAPFIRGDYCKYMFHEQYNAVLVTCYNAEGMLVGHQVRVIQAPKKKCQAVNDVYMPVISISELA